LDGIRSATPYRLSCYAIRLVTISRCTALVLQDVHW